MLCLEANRDKKFALFVSYNPPHAPYDAVPKKYEDLYVEMERKTNAWAKAPANVGDPIPEGLDIQTAARQYYGAVTGIDENIGRLITWLKQNGLYETTYIMISADHGDMLGDHQLVAKHIWYEGAVGIPLLIRGGRVKPMRTQELINGEDQAATILGLLGIPVPETMDGKDFSPLLRGEKFTGHKSIITMAFPNNKEKIEGYMAHGLNFMEYGWRCIITQRYKLAVNKGSSYGMDTHTYLYDRKRDPDENMPIEDSGTREMLMKELKYWCDKNGDGFI